MKGLFAFAVTHWLKIAGIAAILGLVAWFSHARYTSGYEDAAATYQSAIDKQKREASAKLAEEIEKTRLARLELQALISKMEKDREDAQAKNAADLRARRAGPRLQYAAETGSGGSGCAAKAGADGAAKDPGPALVQLPEPLNGNLLDFASDAQSLAIDYGTLYGYLHNPKLVCELRP